MKRKKILNRIKIIYLLVLVLGAMIIAPTHIFPQPYFMYARFPHYLEMMRPFFGITWPRSFEIYHDILYVLGIILSLNGIGLITFPRLRKIIIFSSIVGAFLFLSIALFFFLMFISVNAVTAIIFGSYSLILLVMELLITEVSLDENRHNA